MKRLLCALLALTACANSTDANKDGIADGVKSPSTVSAVAPSTPTGTVSGIVTDTTLTPLQGANVAFVMGGGADGSGAAYTTTTDINGNFSFKNVPAGGNGQVVIIKDGYGAARVSIWVPASAGNLPLDNGNGNVGVVMLTALTATVKFTVLGSTGRPAKGAKGLLEISPSAFLSNSGGSTYGTPLGVVSVTGTVDDVGTLSFANVPDPAELARVGGQYALTVGAWDGAGDGTYDSLGFAKTYTGQELFLSPAQLVLLPDARQSAPLAVLASNVDALLPSGSTAALRNGVKPSDAVTLVFNQAVVAGSALSVKVVGEDCSTPVTVKVEQKAPNLLSITPNAGWTNGVEYELAVHATGVDTGTTSSFIASFWGLDPAVPRAPSTTVAFQAKKAPGATNTTAYLPGDTLYVVFDTPVHYVNGGAAQAFVNLDLNSNGSIGGTGGADVGEYNAKTGLGVTLSEQTFEAASSTFTCAGTTTGSRWQVAIGAVPTSGVPSGTPMKVVIPKDSLSSSGYETIWGQPFSGEYSGTLTVIP